MYKDNRTVGVVGMDIDFDVLAAEVEDMRVYDTGYAFLTDGKGNVMYHKDLPVGVAMTSVDNSFVPVVSELENGTSGSSLFTYSWKDGAKKMASRSLQNGMRLAVTAPVAEIDAAKNQLMMQICVAT